MAKLRGVEEELPILRAHYELVLWLLPKIALFSRDLRFTLGERIERRLFDILETLVQAKLHSAKRELLNRANIDLEVLRFQLRLAHDTRALATKAYGDAAMKLREIGKQLGGWLKQARE